MAEPLTARLLTATLRVVEDVGGLFPIEDLDRLHGLIAPFMRRPTHRA